MRKIFLGVVVSFLLCQVLPCDSSARTGYVSDKLVLTLREQPSLNTAVIDRLPSDTPLTILEENDEYMKVNLESGETGWVDKRFVVFELPKSILIQQLQEQNQNLTEQLNALKASHDSSKKELLSQIEGDEDLSAAQAIELEEAKEKIKELEIQAVQARKKYDILLNQSGNIKELVDTNKKLTRENNQLTENILALENQTGYLFRTGLIKWFLAGVGVLLMGWVLGHSVSLGKKRRSSLLD